MSRAVDKFVFEERTFTKGIETSDLQTSEKSLTLNTLLIFRNARNIYTWTRSSLNDRRKTSRRVISVRKIGRIRRKRRNRLSPRSLYFLSSAASFREYLISGPWPREGRLAPGMQRRHHSCKQYASDKQIAIRRIDQIHRRFWRRPSMPEYENRFQAWNSTATSRSSEQREKTVCTCYSFGKLRSICTG